MKPSELMCSTIVHSDTKNAKARVRPSQVSYTRKTQSSALKSIAEYSVWKG